MLPPIFLVHILDISTVIDNFHNIFHNTHYLIYSTTEYDVTHKMQSCQKNKFVQRSKEHIACIDLRTMLKWHFFVTLMQQFSISEPRSLYLTYETDVL